MVKYNKLIKIDTVQVVYEDTLLLLKRGSVFFVSIKKLTSYRNLIILVTK